MFLVQKKSPSCGVCFCGDQLVLSIQNQNLNSMASMKTEAAVLAGWSRKSSRLGAAESARHWTGARAAYTKRLRCGHEIGSHELYYYIWMPSFIRIIWKNTSSAAGSSTIHDLCTLLPASGSRSRWSPPSLLSRGHFNKTRGRYLLNDNIIKICIQRPFLSESKMVPAEQMDSEFSLAH